MINLPAIPTLPVRFAPSKDTLAVLNEREWICSFSGGKDSSSLVTWIEWLRRVGLVQKSTPRLVMSDTTVEFPFLRGIADRLMGVLRKSGWDCEIVTPRINEKLYNRIFGIGNTPVHPGGRKMRWCTRATKIDPMKRRAKLIAPDVVQLSGVRWGESDNRDGKLSAGGCAVGGECGLPEPGEGVYGPIIAWKTCKVVEWLSGEAGEEINAVMADLLPMMRELVNVYEVKKGQAGMFGGEPKVTAMRFGCIGCPAITREKITRSKAGREQPQWIHLRRLYDVWQALYLRKNRCCRIRPQDTKTNGPKPKWGSDHFGFGPVRMAARQHYFAEVLDIQRQSGVTLVTPEDEAFIRDCWKRKAYPRGWSEADELTVPPEDGLFANVT